MPTPTRPSTGAPIESGWGQEVHDAAFLPAGGRWRSQSSAINSLQLPIALVADTDPGVWLSAPGATSLVVPADGAGLYACDVFCRPNVGDTGLWYWHVYLNGAMALGWEGDTPNNQAFGMSAGATLPLVAGDVLQFLWWQRPTAVARLDLQRWTMTRIGHAWGLP